MSSLVNDIRREAQSNASKDAENTPTLGLGTEALGLEQALNKLFYAPKNYPEELRMIKMQKMQAQQQGDRYGLHCSAIIASENEFCYREQVLSLFYKQAQGENIPIKQKRVFEEGNFVGEKWQRLLVSSGAGKKEDMDISRFLEKYDLSYTPDVAKAHLINKDWLIEIKSMNMFSFAKATSHPSGRKQLRMYMFFERMKHGFVLVENKNDQEFKVFPEIYGVTFTKEDIQPYLDRLKVVQEHKKNFLENKEMVEHREGCNSPTCKRALKCNMRDACYNIGMGRVKLGAR